MLYPTGIILLLILSAVFYTAYIYHPSEKMKFRSEYLQTIDSQYLSMKDFTAHFIHAGNGKPVILIHGGGTWLYSFRDNLPFLARDFSVYAVDMPGHGYTKTWLDHPRYDLEMYRRFLLEFMERQQLAKVSLIGNSWGGGWALYFAQQHPEKVDKLVLIDSSGLSRHDAFEWEIFKYPVLGEAASKFINEASVAFSLKKVFYDGTKVSTAMIREVAAPLRFAENRRAQCLAERYLDWRHTIQNIKNVRSKTLIIWGRNDKYLDYHTAYQFQKKINGSELLLLDHCGHVAHEDRPDAVNRAIAAFLHHQ